MSGKTGYSRIVGIIGKPFGIKGYVFVRMVTDYPDTILKGTILYLDESLKNKMVIQDAKTVSVKNGIRTVLKFEGYETLNDSEKLRGKQIFRAAKDQPLLESGTNWVDELIGCKVILKDGESIGTVMDVENCAYNDNLIIHDAAGRTITIPMYDQYIDSIDLENRNIIIKEIPEYI
jgi:16S rRNA processing protein RimM